MLLASWAVSALAGPWEGPRLTEDQLREEQTSSGNKGRRDAKPNSLKNVARYHYHLSYVKAFLDQKAAVASPVAQGSGGTPNPLMVATMVDGIARGPLTPTNNALFAASVGLDVVSWLLTDNTADDMAASLRRDKENFEGPSLWLIRQEQKQEMSDFDQIDEFLRTRFLSEQGMILSWPFDCDILYYRATNMFGIRPSAGNYLPGITQTRSYTCGLDEADIGYKQGHKEVLVLAVQRTSEDIWLSRIIATRLDRARWVRKVLALPEDQINFAAKVLYERLKPQLDDAWIAIYTAPDEQGAWQVNVAQGESKMIFSPPALGKK